MNVLEWIVILEAVFLATAGLFWFISLFIGGQEGDEFTRFFRTFWRIFLRRRGRLKQAVTALDVEKARQYEEMKQAGDVEGIKELLDSELGPHGFDEDEISRSLQASMVGSAEPEGAANTSEPRAASVTIKVIPFAKTDELVSLHSDGITLQVISGPEEGQANKAVIDLVAGALKIKPYQITLLKGHYKPVKTLQIAGFTQRELDAKLASYS